MTLKIQIIGRGMVGSAQEYLCKNLGYSVTCYDVALPNSKIEKNVDVTFICVPERAVEDTLERLLALGVQGLYVIKSTVPIGETMRLSVAYGVHLCHNPEFLREKERFEDVMNPSRVLIGQCCPEHGDMLRRFYAKLDVPVFVATPTETETVKVLSNSIRAYMIGFCNEADKLCKKLGVATENVVGLLNPERTLFDWEGGNWGTKFFGKPYDGKCLPKDVNHLINTLDRLGLDPALFEALQYANKNVAKPDQLTVVARCN